MSEEELPLSTCPSGRLVLRVEGLSSGAAVDVLNKDVGYIVFLRSRTSSSAGHESPEAANFAWYRNNVFLPWLQEVRSVVLGMVPGEEVPEHLAAVSWLDGGGPQLAAVTSEHHTRECLKYRVCTNKHSAATSARQQHCDRCSLFRAFHFLEGAMLVDWPAATHLKSRLEIQFRDLGGVLRLKPTHKAALIDFLCRLPAMLAKAMTPSAITNAFVSTGLLDAESRMQPNFATIVGNISRPVSLAEEKLCFDMFDDLYQYGIEHGQFPDRLLSEMGFPVDISIDGSEVRRLGEISQEGQQRAKVLTHDVQVLLRQQRITQAQQSAAEVHAKEVARYEKVLDLNRKCLEELSKAAPAGEYSLEQLSRCKKDQLQCFVHARASKSALGVTSAGLKKGTVNSAARGEDCLLRRAFLAQNRPVILEEPVAKVLARQIAGIPLLPATVLTLGAAQPGPLASELLADRSFVSKVRSALSTRLDSVSFDADRADLLQKAILRRLAAHVATKVVGVSKRAHWVWEFSRTNAAAAAAIIELQGHAREDMASASLLSSLLGNPTALLRCEGPVTALQGVYMYYDTANSAWVRAGKTNRTFGARHTEHSEGARLTSLDSTKSKFYT